MSHGPGLELRSARYQKAGSTPAPGSLQGEVVDKIYITVRSPMYVDNSKIHGKGLFTREYLAIGRVFRLVSYRVPKESVEDDTDEWEAERSYTKTLDLNPRAVEDTDGGWHNFFNPFCFLNHSDDPNSVLYYEDEKFTLEIIKSVHPKEVVTFDYEG